MEISNKVAFKAVIIGGLIAILSSSVAVYAVTGFDFSDRAAQWVENNCSPVKAEKSQPRESEVTCYNYQLSQQNSNLIEQIQNSSSDSPSYMLPEWRIQSSSIYDGNRIDESQVTMVPADGKISIITATNISQGWYMVDGTIEFEVLVNGVDSGFRLTLTSAEENNISTNGEVLVKAGDLVSIKRTTNNIIYPGSIDSTFSMTHKVGLLVSQ